MKSRLIATILVLTAFVAGTASAEWNGAKGSAETTAAPATAKPTKWSVNMTILESAGPTSGPCTGGDGLADYCPTGDCACYTYTGSASGSAGSGPVTFLETFDMGGSIGGANSGCAPAYGDIEITGSKDTESIAFEGADCGSAFTSNLLIGGCQIVASDIYGQGALGDCAGTYSTSFRTKFSIKGAGAK